MTDINVINKSSNIWTVISILVLAILLVLSYKFIYQYDSGVAATVDIDTSCDLRKGSCISELPDGGKVSFSISPKDIPIMRPLKLDVLTAGVDVSNVNIELHSIGMNMGNKGSKLKATATNQYEGEATIPLCIRSKMDWEARVYLQTDCGLIMVPYRFYTTKK